MNTNLENYIYVNNNSLSKELCADIIQYFEEEPNKTGGVTAGGLNTNVKDTIDFQIPHKNVSSKWNKIRVLLEKELTNNIQQYVKNITDNISVQEELSSNKYRVFNDAVTFETMQMQRYTKSSGKYIFHNDFQAEFEKKQYRIITYLWYINTVDEGGETEIWNNYKVKPEAGKLILFPATWTYPHRGKVPISNDKYIITGWVYEPSK